MVDSRPRPLTEKLLEHPRLIERIRAAIVAPERSLHHPVQRLAARARAGGAARDPGLRAEPRARVGRDEERRAADLRRGGRLATRSGSRTSRAWTTSSSAIAEIARQRPDVPAGDGEGERRRQRSRQRPRHGRAERRGVGARDRARGSRPQRRRVLRLHGRARRRSSRSGSSATASASPSAQLRVLPNGIVEVLSTHDQILGGPHGQTYVGCRLPADPAYATAIGREARKVGERLSREGVIGRFAVDFVAVRRNGAWEPYAVEINLRNGGTTHPVLTLQALTDGEYQEETGLFLSGDGAREALRRDRRPRERGLPRADAGRRARHRRGRAHRLGRRAADGRRAAHGQRDRRRGPDRPDRDRRLARRGRPRSSGA